MFDSVLFGSTAYNRALAQAFATDLQGNVIWTYRYSGTPANVITPIKLLPNGHFLLNLTVTPPPNGPPIPAGTLNDIREIDLAGNTIRDLSCATLNQALAAHGFSGFNLFAFSRDMLALPNGHFVFLVAMAKEIADVVGYPGTTNVAGDVLWRLGEGGDFRLIGGVDPTDWFYAQHGMNFFGEATSGVFKLGLLDDGDDRMFPPGINCGTAGEPPCLYSTPAFVIQRQIPGWSPSRGRLSPTPSRRTRTAALGPNPARSRTLLVHLLDDLVSRVKTRQKVGRPSNQGLHDHYNAIAPVGPMEMRSKGPRYQPIDKCRDNPHNRVS